MSILAEVKQKTKTIRKYQKGAEMAYKKPEVVAKSEAKQSFVAGCAVEKMICGGCNYTTRKCMVGPMN